MTQPTWGIISTIKAPTETVLDFAAYHLDLGADHLFIFLDDANEETAARLNAHPAITATCTDEAYWRDWLGRRPKKHQVRQVRNASRCYRRAKSLDWVTHIDVDEFLCPARPMHEILADQPKDLPSLRIAPVESLCVEGGDGATQPGKTYCKTKVARSADRARIEAALYPNFGGFFKDGFVSHTAGKIMARTGHPNVKFGIHRIFENQNQEMAQHTTPEIELCHTHVESWTHWLDIMEFRLTKGSYRAELEKGIAKGSPRLSRHSLFSSLTEGGTEDLRSFFEEVCLATPRLLEALKARDMLRIYELDLSHKRQKHFGR